MSNAQTGSNWFVDSTGSLTDNKQQRIAYIVFTSKLSTDALTLKDSSSGSNIITIKNGTADKTEVYDFSSKPLVFPSGIYVQAISSNCTATIITV